jgi:CubicO group peptidase (beta-lactamase class C family)
MGMGMESAMTPDAWLASLSELPLVFQPGERFNYGHSTDVLGFLAARVLGKDLANAMREKLFEPLGMTDTGFWVPLAKRSRLSKFYIASSPGEFMPSGVSAFSADAPAAYVSGGQGLASTAADYARFATMLLGDGKRGRARVLKSETARRMRTNQFTEEQRRQPFVAGTPFTQGFGLGMSVVLDAHQPGIVSGGVGTFGWPGAFGGWWQADPQANLMLLWLQQCAPTPPQPGVAVPRLPGQHGTMQFRKCVYDIINGGTHAHVAD